MQLELRERIQSLLCRLPRVLPMTLPFYPHKRRMTHAAAAARRVQLDALHVGELGGERIRLQEVGVDACDLEVRLPRRANVLTPVLLAAATQHREAMVVAVEGEDGSSG